MVILGEIDDGITSYLAITPIGKSGYLVSRLVLPMISSFFMSAVVLFAFSLTRPSFDMIVVISIMSSIFGFIMSMIVVTMSTNKVEGLAVMKLSNLLTIGIIAPFFVSNKLQIIFYLFPSFWISKFVIENTIFDFIIFVAVSMVWILLLLKKFMRKIK